MPGKQKSSHSSHHHLLQAEKLELVKSGQDYFNRLLHIINNSKHILHLQTYIFIDDETGKEVIAALQNAVKRGVKVKVLVDAFGSFAMHHQAIQDMIQSGIEFRKFSPLFVNHRIRFGRRLHHKIVVADAQEAMIGGINIENKYHLNKGDNTPWLDYAAYISGPIGQYIDYICERTWKGKFYRARMNSHHLTNHEQKGDIPVRIRQNDWVLKKEGISLGHREALKHSKESIIIIGSYFLPGRRIRKLLKNASARKVNIQLILQGTSDVTMVRNATKWWYAWLLRNNIEIYEWTQTILHGKVMLIDNNWSTVGSYNINHISDYESIETNIDTQDRAFCISVKEEMERVMQYCGRVTSAGYKHEMNLLEQFKCWSSFHILRILINLQSALLAKE
jgi:cardiolipin synthase